MSDIITICNMALGHIPQARIVSLDENSKAAKECAFWYPISRNLLLGKHTWSWSKKRVVLAQAVNDRTLEWTKAYALPIDAAYPIQLVPNASAPGVWYTLLPGNAQSVEGWANTLAGQRSFEIAGTVLYTHEPYATLEYCGTDGIEDRFDPMFSAALALEMASMMEPQLRGDDKRQQGLIGSAKIALDQAICADRNRQPQSYDLGPSQVDLVRRGAA